MNNTFIVANLDSRYPAEVDDIIINPPTRGMHLRSLAGDIEIKPTLLRSLLLQRLPLHVQAILQGQSTLEPDQMADMAYRIMEVPFLTAMPSVNSIDPIVASASPRVSVTLESLAERVKDVAKQVKLLQARFNARALRISLGGHTDLHVFHGGTVTGLRYRDEILDPYVRPYAAAIGNDFILMNDNARPHRAGIFEEYLEDHGLERMEWPARSPDLNPIEHQRGEL
ncbi:transposable element Tcb2 transposase [Trichonephila clavipes]|nr:transposable element Tcb2 transposase [Trichonephila clavipes]